MVINYKCYVKWYRLCDTGDTGDNQLVDLERMRINWCNNWCINIICVINIPINSMSDKY